MIARPVVLFVDDEQQLLDSVKDLLFRDYEVVTASSAREGLALLASRQIPLVVSDLQMPDMDGITFLHEVNQRLPATVRILLTGHADVGTAVRAVNQGAIFRLLVKPCAPDELQTALRDGVEQHRMMNADRDLLAARVEELSASLVRAERLATIGTMAAATNHELNNALSVMCAAIAEVREVYEAKGIVEEDTVRLLESGEQRLRRQAKGVLALARSGEDARGIVDVAEVARSVVELLRSLGVAKHVMLGIAVDDKPTTITGHRGEIEQVLTNLVKNAIDAIEDAGRRRGTVNLEVHGGRDVEVVVRDDGNGIPAEQLKKIFNAFFTTKAPGRGTGLGLPVVKQLVTAHGGTIAVTSEVGVGTRFIIGLPGARVS